MSKDFKGGGQDRKFGFDAEKGQFVNRVSGEAIPLDEPIVIFRARDLHAVTALVAYANKIRDPHHKQAIKERIAEFTYYSSNRPERMKEPGITQDIRLNSPSYSIHPQNEPNGEGNGWLDCKEDEATSWVVEDNHGALDIFPNRAAAELWMEHLKGEDAAKNKHD